jgi:hypothetical protein
MGYTTISNVAGMFPTFVRGTSQQKPADTLIQRYVDDVAAEINAVLDRRFSELILSYGAAPPANFQAFLAALPAASALWQAGTAYALGALALDTNGGVQQATAAGTSGASAPAWSAIPGGSTTDNTVVWQNVTSDASRVLEKINRYGAGAQLGETLATFGIASAKDTAKNFRDEYLKMFNDLDARGDRGAPLPSGGYDHLFDALARTETPRPGLKSIAGGDQAEDQTPADTGSSQVFGKFDKRGT